MRSLKKHNNDLLAKWLWGFGVERELMAKGCGVEIWDGLSGRVKSFGGGMVVVFGNVFKGLKMFFGGSFVLTLDLGMILNFGWIGGWGSVQS